MDLHDVAALLAPSGAPLRFRKGAVSAIAADGTLSVKVAGSSTVVSGVKALSSVCPKVGAGVWLATDGLDLFAIGTIAPVGPAFADLNRPTDQSIANATDTAIDFTSSAVVDADTHSMFSTGASDRLTVKAPGVYGFTYTVAFPGNASGLRAVWVEVDGAMKGRLVLAGHSIGTNMLTAATEVECALNSVVKLWVRQSSGAALACQSLAYAPRLTAAWRRPLPS